MADILNTEDLNRTVFISDNLPFLQRLDNESIDLVVIDPPFSKNQTFVGKLKPPLTRDEQRIERELMDNWQVYDPATAYELGIEYPDQTGTTAKFEDIWNFGRLVFRDDMDELKKTHPAAWWLIHSTRYTHSDSTAAYIYFMVQRMVEVRRVLKSTGSVYLHCDHDANAYLRQMMDAIFGESNCRNEISWRRNESGAKGSQHAPKSWGNNVGTILFYSKSAKFNFDPRKRSLDEESRKKKFPKIDDRGERYNTKLTAWCQPSMGARPNLCYEFLGVLPPYPSGWRLKRERMEEEYAKGNIVLVDSKLERRSYERDYSGVSPGNLWTDKHLVLSAQSAERTGYPTQKPQELARRIIEASSNPGDMVLDCFAGCAYVPVAAELSDRRWIACDMSPRAWTVVRRQFHKRPELGIVTDGELDDDGVKVSFDNRDKVIRVLGPHDLPDRTTAEKPISIVLHDLPAPQFRQKAHESGDVIWQAFVDKWGTGCWYCGTEKAADRRELQLDHIEPTKRDGTNDDCFNRALACAPCNSDKRNNLTVEETIDKALEAGRIATPALRDEVLVGFKKRRQRAIERWEQIKPPKQPGMGDESITSSSDNGSQPFVATITAKDVIGG